MPTDLLSTAEGLNDGELLRRCQALADRERGASVELIAHLSVLDARRAYLAAGYGSLFAYCTDALRLSEDASYSRILAARLARRFPVILDLLGDGSVNLTTVRLLAAHFTPENHRDLLAEASGKGRRQIELLVARLAPLPDVAASIRKLPQPAPSATVSLGLPGPALSQAVAWQSTFPQPASESTQERGAALTAPAVSALFAPVQPAGTSAGRPAATLADGSSSPQPPAVSLASARRPAVIPLAPERYRVQFTVGRETYERLQRVQDLLCREIPDGDPGVIFDRALALLLETIERKKVAATRKQPQAPVRPTTVEAHRPALASRRIPRGVIRAVWRRDAARCAFIAADGRRCAERRYLELHHVRPYAQGGQATIENISLRCRRHNVYECDLVFGRYDASVVREVPAPYAGSCESPLRFVTCFGTG